MTYKDITIGMFDRLKKITSDELSWELGVSTREASRILSGLLEDGVIEVVGKKKPFLLHKGKASTLYRKKRVKPYMPIRCHDYFRGDGKRKELWIKPLGGEHV